MVLWCLLPRSAAPRLTGRSALALYALLRFKKGCLLLSGAVWWVSETGGQDGGEGDNEGGEGRAAALGLGLITGGWCSVHVWEGGYQRRERQGGDAGRCVCDTVIKLGERHPYVMHARGYVLRICVGETSR